MNCILQSRGIILQICNFLEAIDESIYTAPLSLFNQSSVGKHVRHIHGFFECLVTASELGVVNYDKRNRDPRIENDPVYCKISFLEMVPKIEQMDTNKELVILSGMHREDQDLKGAIGSTLGREIIYAFEHALHHLAIVKMGMRAHYPEIVLDENMGVAPSTIEYRNSCAQ
ncbi:MAG: hypothetical protein AAF502_22080 [Bacteroidota bacterium]